MRRTLAKLTLWFFEIILVGIPWFAHAQPQFLTLPFQGAGIVIQQGWLYSTPGHFSCPQPEGERCHRGIDYIRGVLDDVSSWSAFDVLAAAEGKAIASRSTYYGLFVYIAHDERDLSGNRYFTLYAHLKMADAPEITLAELRHAVETDDFSEWSHKSRGMKIGVAGDSGSPGVLHSHFEVQRGGYPLNKTDPYDIENTREFYTDSVVCDNAGPNYLWTECPPVPFSSESPPEPELIVDVPWQMFGRDPQHTGQSPAMSVQTGVVKWVANIGKCIRSSPTIDKDGTIYVVSDSNELTAVKPNGDIKWVYNIGGVGASYLGKHFGTAISSDNRSIYAGLLQTFIVENTRATPFILAMNSDGTKQWEFEGDYQWYDISQIIVDKNDNIYFSAQPYLLSLTRNGTERWRSLVAHPTVATIGTDGTIYMCLLLEIICMQLTLKTEAISGFILLRMVILH